jgi:hypothetical protein
MKNNLKAQITKLLQLLIVLAFLLSPAEIPKAAGLWFVAPGGSDSSTCLSSASACATINGAIAKAASGDTILVASGTYTGSGDQVVTPDKPISLSGGWNNSFTTQDSFTVIDGEHTRGGMYAENISISVERFVFQNGYALAGGGIYSNGDLTLDHCTIAHNMSLWYGGGVAVWGNLVIRFSAVYGNRAIQYGGGVVASGQLVMENTTVSGNTAEGIGGGLRVYYSSPSVSLNNNTFYENVAAEGGGFFIDSLVQNIAVRNTIIAGNTATTASDCGGKLVSIGHNLIGDTTGCDYTAGMGDLTNTDSHVGRLIGLENHPRYRPLLSGSLAIDAGDPAGCFGSQGLLSTDQRGAARVGRCDIGAYEYTTPGPAASAVALSGTPQHAQPGRLFPQRMEAAVLDSNGSPVNGVQVAFVAPASGASGTFSDTGTSTTTTATDESGVATAPEFIANMSMGNYQVSATANGVATPARFSLSNISWYVAPTGSDANTCASPAAPCRTIGAAIAKALPGDMLYAATGLYTGSGGVVALVDRDLSLSGGWNLAFTAQDGFSIIDSEEVRSGLSVPPGVTAQAENFIIQNSPAGIDYMGVNCSGRLTLNNVKVRDNKMIGIYVRDATGYLTLNNSSVSSNEGVGILINWASEVVLNNSTVDGNGDSVSKRDISPQNRNRKCPLNEF